MMDSFWKKGNVLSALTIVISVKIDIFVHNVIQASILKMVYVLIVGIAVESVRHKDVNNVNQALHLFQDYAYPVL